MSTDYFFKRILYTIVSLTFTAFCAFGCIYAGIIRNAQKVEGGSCFYFLVTDDTKTEVGAEFAKLEGGAGYLLEHEGKEYVTLAVYVEESEGVAVQQNLQKAGKTTFLLQKSTPMLWFKGKEKKQASFYVSGLNTLKSYLYALKSTIDCLDEGLSQERCKGLLNTQVRQYKHAKECYKEYKKLSEVFEKSAQQLVAILDGVIYLKDLRYLLCWQTEKYLALCSEFSL